MDKQKQVICDMCGHIKYVHWASLAWINPNGSYVGLHEGCEGAYKVFEAINIPTVPNERNEESAVKSEFIRDMTSVVPIPKSEVRRRLEEILQAERTRIIKALEGLYRLDAYNTVPSNLEANGWNKAIERAIKAVEEKE